MAVNFNYSDLLLLINNSVGISHCNCQPCSYNNSKNFGLCINVTCFQKQPPLFRLKVSQIPQENTCVGVSFFPWNDEIIKRYLFCMSEGRCPFSECELCKWCNLLGIFFSIYIWGQQNVLFTWKICYFYETATEICSTK